MRKRNKAHESIISPPSLNSTDAGDVDVSSTDITLCPLSKAKPLISSHNTITAVSNSVTKEKTVAGKDLKLLHQKNPEPADGRIEYHDASKKNGWRKIEFTLDQQIPLCKDFHDTGYCTFGPACKYLHTREDMCTAEQLNMRNAWKVHMDQFDKSERARKEKLRNKDKIVPEPDVCVICHKLLKDPVITKCNHKFCSACALRRYMTDQTCAVCGCNTEGIFNTAPK